MFGSFDIVHVRDGQTDEISVAYTRYIAYAVAVSRHAPLARKK